MISTTELWELIGRLSRIDPLTRSPTDAPLAPGQGQGYHSSELDGKSSGEDNGNCNTHDGGSGGCGSGGRDEAASTSSITNYLLHLVSIHSPLTHPVIHPRIDPLTHPRIHPINSLVHSSNGYTHLICLLTYLSTIGLPAYSVDLPMVTGQMPADAPNPILSYIITLSTPSLGACRCA